MKPNRITISSSKRGTTVKATGHAAQALFDALTKKVDPQLARQAIGPCTVHFEDRGQDFTSWDVDAQGVVTDSRPFQRDQWAGTQLLAPPVVGELLRVRTPRQTEGHCMNYPVIRITRTVVKPAIQSGGTGG